MSEESREDCPNKPDLKKEAQRTNRFNTNTSQNFATPCFTTCNHVENTSQVTNDYKIEQNDDIPCINIILKPILDTKIDQKDKGIQIVEVTAITENNNKRSVNDTITPLSNQYQSSSKDTEKVEMKSMKVQNDVKKNVQNTRTRSMETSANPQNTCVSLSKKTTPEATVENLIASQLTTDANSSRRNRGVQFRDDNVSCNPNTRSLPRDNSTCNINDLTSVVTPTACLDSMETLYKFVNSENKPKKTSEFKSCVGTNGQGMQGKLSDRIKHDIDKLEIGSCVSTHSSAHTMNTQQESINTEKQISTCTDICKDIASQVELLKTYSDKIDSSSAAQNTSTLASVFSNNPPIPRFSINTTETTEWESPSKNKSSKVTIGTTISDSSFSRSSNNTPAFLDQKSSIEGISRVTDRNVKKNFNTTERNIEKFNGGTESRGFWPNETTTLSKLEINGNSSVKTKSTNTISDARTLESTDGLPLLDNNSLLRENSLGPDKCCRSIAVQTNSISARQTPEYRTATNTKFGDKLDFVLSRPNTGNFITASELTRPEFMRMLTEIKEHTRSLELQLSAMNEALKRKQATRRKAVSSTLRNYEPIKENCLDYRAQNKKLKTTNDLSSIEHASFTLEELSTENLMDIPCCALLDDISLAKDGHPEIETVNDEACCESFQLTFSRKPKTSSHMVLSSKPEQVVVAQDESNISISKHQGNKPALKTRRSYLWAPLRESDYRIWKRKLEKRAPSANSTILPETLSRSVSPNSLMASSRIEVSCSLKNCCNVPEDSLQTMFKAGNLSPVNKPGKCSTYSTASNPSINQTTVRPAFMNSTLKETTEAIPSSEYAKPPDPKAMSTTMLSSSDLDTSNYSYNEKGHQNRNMKPVLGMTKKNDEHDAQTSSVKLRRPKVKPKLGIKHNSLKSRNKGRPISIPSNSNFYSSMGKDPSHESSKNFETEHDESEAVPSVKTTSMDSRSLSHSYIEKEKNQDCLDSKYCSAANENDEIISEVNISSHSTAQLSEPVENVPAKLLDKNQGKDHLAYAITTEQNTPFLAMNFSKYNDSEKEMSSTEYGLSKSGEKGSRKETKDNVNGKKRKRNSGGKNLTRMDEITGFSHSNTSKLCSWQNDSQSSQHNSKSEKNSQSITGNQHSVKFKKFDDISGKSNRTNSQQKDSKCTIRVTVSLDETPSNEEVKKI